MLDWTDRHCRYFLRLISKHALLYTEMVTTGAILKGDRDYHLRYNQSEHPVALQLGGSDPIALAECTDIAEQYGYDEVNLNVGCPSDRVQEGRFGACLMAEPELVAECVNKMQSSTTIPVSVKTRIGIDHHDTYEFLCRFIEHLRDVGCQTFIIHARKAWLQGLSPKENREIPPLHYDTVYRVKQDHPDLNIIINGGITTIEQASQHMTRVDGVMIGREAYHNPCLLADVDRLFYHDNTPQRSRHEVIEMMIPYLEKELKSGAKLNHITRHMLGLYQGIPGARAWRRHLSEHAYKSEASIETLKQAVSYVEDKTKR
jgi:tRNA-dihydrouridine synthase A